MKATLNNATIKIWFSNLATCRNIPNVVEIEHNGNLMKVTDNKNNVILINFSNVNMVEEVK